jgi:hypothetical protein
MANKISNFAEGDVDLTAIMQTLNAICKGLPTLTLTNLYSVSEPEIAAGSVIEVNGALYYFEENEGISGSPSDGTVYVRLVPSSDSNSDDFIYAEYTNTAPTWSDEKHGWYDSGGNYRYVAQMTLVSGSYINKAHFVIADMIRGIDNSNNMKFKIINIGTWDMNTDGTKNVPHFLIHTKIRSVQVTIIEDDEESGDNRFNICGSNSSGELYGGVMYNESNIICMRASGGIFDTALFESTANNRGWITIGYVD